MISTRKKVEMHLSKKLGIDSERIKFKHARFLEMPTSEDFKTKRCYHLNMDIDGEMVTGQQLMSCKEAMSDFEL